MLEFLLLTSAKLNLLFTVLLLMLVVMSLSSE